MEETRPVVSIYHNTVGTGRKGRLGTQGRIYFNKFARELLNSSKFFIRLVNNVIYVMPKTNLDNGIVLSHRDAPCRIATDDNKGKYLMEPEKDYFVLTKIEEYDNNI